MRLFVFSDVWELNLRAKKTGMSFFKGLLDSLSSALPDSVVSSSRTGSSPTSPSSSSDPPTEDVVETATSAPFSNQRTAYKLKGYFDLAKDEIAKAVRAEEWGLLDDAILHYNNAHRILVEANSTRAPSFVSPSEHQKVKSYHQKISKWQNQVSERLETLTRRSAGTSIDKGPSINVKAAPVPAANSSTRKVVLQKPLGANKSRPILRSQTQQGTSSNPTRESAGGYDEKLVEMINTVIVDRNPSVKWEDVAGLENAKQTLLEMVILPTKRRDLFTGLRRPPRGLLLFGPPGNGKTMLAKAVASESDATFFNVSASSLTSKWVGEGEKLVRTLFMVAISRQPSVIFFDEMDSIMSTRVASEHDASRRLKSEFLVQFDGVSSNSDDLIIVIGATNKPQEIDDAVLRRLAKRIYVPLPDIHVRRLLLKNRLKGHAFSLPGGDLERLARETEGYTGSDLQALCEEAAMMPIRELGGNILTIQANQVRPLKYEDFDKAMTVIRPSLQKSKWEELQRWNLEFGAN